MAAASLNNDSLALRCPVPHMRKGMLGANLSILLHVAIFAIPLLVSFSAHKIKIPQKQISVNLVSVAAPSVVGDIEQSKIVENKENNTKRIIHEKAVKLEEKQPKKIEKKIVSKKAITSVKVNKPVVQKIKKAATRRQITSNSNGNSVSTVIQALKDSDYVRTTPPAYPRRAINLGMQGTVTVKALINNSGKAEKVMILNSSGFLILDNSAVKAVSKWFFKPSSLNPNFNKTWVKVPVKFILR